MDNPTKILGDILGPNWKVQTPGQYYAESLRREAANTKSLAMKQIILDYANRAEQPISENK